MIVEKAVKMAKLMNVPIIGIVQNMSYFVCPSCKEKHYIFGKNDIEKIAKDNGIKITAELPIDGELTKLSDSGQMEGFKGDYLDDLIKELTK